MLPVLISSYLPGFAKTFEVLPIGNGLSLDVTASTLTSALSVAFVAVLQIAGPIIAVLFLADIGLGLLTRVAPTINIFVLSFPPSRSELPCYWWGLPFPG